MLSKLDDTTHDPEMQGRRQITHDLRFVPVIPSKASCKQCVSPSNARTTIQTVIGAYMEDILPYLFMVMKL